MPIEITLFMWFVAIILVCGVFKMIGHGIEAYENAKIWEYNYPWFNAIFGGLFNLTALPMYCLIALSIPTIITYLNSL